jgi:hypothetical protein
MRTKTLPALRLWIVVGAVAGMASAPLDAPRAASEEHPPGGAPVASAASAAPAYLCSPQTQLRDARRCPAAGPGGARAELARQGLSPLRPLPIARLDLDLGFLPFSYRQLDRDGTSLYSSPDDAVAGAGASGRLDPGLVYVSWSDCQVISDTAVYLTPSGYIRGGSDCKQIELPSFRGLAFSRTPSRPFAWILGTTNVRTAPGTAALVTGQRYRFQIVQVFEWAQAEDLSWAKIGPEAWVAAKDVAAVTPDPARPEGVESDRWISINLFEQTLAVYEQGKLVFATMVSAGLPGWWTQPGTFQVYAKLERDHMSGAFEADRSDYYLLQDVPWVMYYDKARALHGAYWHNGYGYARSHGCVNLSPTDAHWLFNWAEEGTYVHVFDPSGQTPTDPKTYGDGGA